MKLLLFRFALLFCAQVFAQISFAQIEIPASFVGGSDAYHDYLDKNLKYPEKAYQSGESFKVKALVIIREDGTAEIEDFLTDKSDLGFEEEVTRFISEMPKWNPAKHSGVNAETQIILSFNFQLEEIQRTVKVQSSTERTVQQPKAQSINQPEFKKNEVELLGTDIPPFFDGDNDSLISKVKGFLMVTHNMSEISGTCEVKFEVSETGSLDNFTFSQNTTNITDDQYSQALTTVGNWKPALLNGKKVKSEAKIKLTFN